MIIHSWDTFVEDKINKLNNVRNLLIRDVANKGRTIINKLDYLNFQSNDYLGLSQHPRLIKMASDSLIKHGIGSTGANTLNGYTIEHHYLQNEIADWLHYDKCLLFNSGYQMNVGLFSAFKDQNTHVWLDENCHASHIDGILLAKIKFTRFNQNNLQQIEDKICNSHNLHIILTEGTYSMDGTNSNLLKLIQIKQQHQQRVMLIIDDAHGIAALGKNGYGTLEQTNNNMSYCDILLGTFGKAFGTHGGFLCTNELIAKYLQNIVKSHIYSTSMPPAIITATRASLQIIQSNNGASLREQLNNNIQYFKECASANKINIYQQSTNVSPIQLIIFDNNQFVDFLYNKLIKQQILVAKIRYPTVPKHQPRIRISLNANHKNNDIENLIDYITITMKELPHD